MNSRNVVAREALDFVARPTGTAAISREQLAARGAARAVEDAGRPRRVAGRVALLNAFALSGDGVEVRLSLPAQRLLAFLALHEHPVMREYVAGTLWLDSTQEHAAGSLRSALCTLRQAGCELVETANGRLRLAPSVIVDVREGVTWARQVFDPSTELDELIARGGSAPGRHPARLV
jgi:hypothetical protein